jgi:hypothetical protein
MKGVKYLVLQHLLRLRQAALHLAPAGALARHHVGRKRFGSGAGPLRPALAVHPLRRTLVHTRGSGSQGLLRAGDDRKRLVAHADVL